MGEEFKLPASSYEELTKIIKSYGSTKEASLDELSKLCGIPPTQISRNSGFLLATNIVEGGKVKSISEKGKDLARTLQHNLPNEISRAWREIIMENEFLTKMVTAIKIRNGMDPQGFQSHIAYSSGQPNNQYVKTGSGTVIEILKLAGLIEEVDGNLKIKIEDKYSTPNNEVPNEEKGFDVDLNEIPSKKVIQVYSGNNGISINIDIKVEAKFAELDDLGIKLKKILSDLKEIEND